jgi:hypothetical protein
MHVVYSLWTGISSTAWDSISEAVALALNSPSPIEMKNTSAGIQTSHQVFEHRVLRIAVMNDGETPLDLDGSLPGYGGTTEWTTEVGVDIFFPSDEKLIGSG